MITFLHNYLPQPILFKLGFIEVHWYGLLVVLGIIGALSAVLFLARKQNITSDEVINLGFYAIISGLLGARIYAVFLDLPYYLNNPWEIPAVWHGGLAIHGAIIGGGLAILIYAIKKKQSVWLWLDLAAPSLALAQAIGRFGNYFNQEVFGRPTSLPWGIPINPFNRPPGFEGVAYFHPTFLYESGLNLLNFVLLAVLFFWINKGRLEIRDWRSGDGMVFLAYLINYSVIRILMELLRIDQTPLVMGIRWPVVASVLILISSLGGLIFFRRQAAIR